jgi:CBS domain-containing protein
MNTRNVGTLMVLDKDAYPVGILTDRDLAIRVVGDGLDAETLVRDVMSKAPDYVDEDLSIEMALANMRAGPYRRLPVVDKQRKLVGLISLDDILDLLAEEFAEIGRLIRKESPESLASS